METSSPSAQEKSLPSSDAASAFLEGQRGGTVALVTSTALRSGLIMPGLLLAGVPWRKALLASALSSVSITTFILIYMSAKKANARHRLAHNKGSVIDRSVAQLGRRNARQLSGPARQAYRAGRRWATIEGL